MPARPPATPEQIRDVNTRYHDGAAAGYDAKWGIDYGAVGRRQVLGKVRKALGGRPERFGRSLEIGAGTGYFSLNLLRAGVIEESVATDISAGMLSVLEQSAADLGLRVETACCEAAELPFEDDSFDTAVATLVLCTVSDPGQALREIDRVLKPGGRFIFVEHVRADDPGLAKWQDRLHPLWVRFGHGCHCNRPTLDAIEASPLEVETHRRGRIPKAPPIVRPVIEGVATPG